VLKEKMESTFDVCVYVCVCVSHFTKDDKYRGAIEGTLWSSLGNKHN